MIFKSINTNYNSPQGRGWFINPFVRSGRIVKGQIQELREINSGLLWMNKMYRGKKLAYFDVDDSKIRHFRYSFTRPLKWWSPWRLFYDNINFMAGTDDKRYLLKLRFFK